MADKTVDKKVNYPRLPEKQWWALRERFKQSMPGKVTPSYLATVLDMKENSAKANILPALQAIGLVDAQGKSTDLAKRWRDDAEYAAALKEMRERVYPDELLDAIPDPKTARSAAERWFANRTGHGQAAAFKMAHFYELLSDGDPLRRQAKSSKKETPRSPPRRRSSPPPVTPSSTPVAPPDVEEKASKPPHTSPGRMPSVHIDMQIHISPEATPEQIDQIFASMAKHLYQRS